MNNKEFISEVARRTGMKNTDAQGMMDARLSVMGDSFMEGNAIQLSNFGVFEVKKRMERIINQPGEERRLLVPPKLTLTFRPANQVKEQLNKEGESHE